MAIVPSLPSVTIHPIVAASANEYATFEHLARQVRLLRLTEIRAG
jgi:hypothetical protein